jgi:hypothetical protein
MRAGARAAITAGIASLLLFNIRYHPNPVVYFNAFVGGPREAFRDYELDYWGNCMLQGVEWGARMARGYGSALTISGRPEHLVRDNVERFPGLQFRESSDGRHHLDVRLVRGPRGTIMSLVTNPSLYHVETPDGAVLCSVLPGPALGELDETRRRTAARQATNQADWW